MAKQRGAVDFFWRLRGLQAAVRSQRRLYCYLCLGYETAGVRAMALARSGKTHQTHFSLIYHMPSVSRRCIIKCLAYIICLFIANDMKRLSVLRGDSVRCWRL